jgi:hypothetical protein
MTLFDRDQLVDALSDLVAELRADGQTVGIRLVGGAALALRYFDRRSTEDLDALHVRPGTDEAVASAADRVAERRGWDRGWLNFKVTQTGAESQWGRPAAWETIHDKDGIVIQVADAETLLAMKLRANRPGRDTDDIRQLLAICGVSTVEAADELFADYYPGDSLPPRAWQMVTSILADGPLPKPDSPVHVVLRDADTA